MIFHWQIENYQQITSQVTENCYSQKAMNQFIYYMLFMPWIHWKQSLITQFAIVAKDYLF